MKYILWNTTDTRDAHSHKFPVYNGHKTTDSKAEKSQIFFWPVTKT